GRLSSSGNSALREGLSGYAGQIVDAAREERIVGVRHPCHFSFAGSDIRAWHVFARTDKFLFDELSGKAARDPLDLLGRVLLGIEFHASFRTTEGNVDD